MAGTHCFGCLRWGSACAPARHLCQVGDVLRRAQAVWVCPALLVVCTIWLTCALGGLGRALLGCHSQSPVATCVWTPLPCAAVEQ